MDKKFTIKELKEAGETSTEKGSESTGHGKEILSGTRMMVLLIQVHLKML